MWYNEDVMTASENRTPLAETFFNRPTLTVARDLLGKSLVRRWHGVELRGKIVEVEAYIGQEDTACHCSKGRTPRTEVMFGAAGRAYVYFVYGMHYMLNIVTEEIGFPAAILIRAVEPLAGQREMAALRGNSARNLTNGPARLCQAMAIDKQFNGWNLTTGDTLWVADAPTLPTDAIARGTRIGIGYAAPADQNALWRFWLKDNPFVSRKK